MSVARSTWLAIAAPLLLAVPLAGAARAEGALPSLDAPELAQGPYAHMQMLLQKTILRINVAFVEVRVDKPTQTRVAALARGQAYSEGLEQQLANAVIGAERAVVQSRFKRDIPFKRYVGVVRDNLEAARKAGLFSAELEKKVSQGLPEWFGALAERGFLKDDRLIYAVSPDSLRTVVVSAAGQVLVDRMDREQGVRRVVLPSYFGPKCDTREGLLRSLVGAKP